MSASERTPAADVRMAAPADAEAMLFACLQNADSFFPAGGIAFSWGLETLIADGLMRDAAQVEAFVLGQLEQRWNVADRPALVAAHGAVSLERVREIDEHVEATTLASELREGSRRAGASLLTVHARLGTAGAQSYQDAVRAGRAHGHLPVVQGWLWRGAGMSELAAQTVSAHTLCVSLLGAALRLGAIGHLHGQRILLQARATMVELLRTPALALEDMYNCVPATEIASMRHETQASRLFAN
jgi:urease accessory protein